MAHNLLEFQRNLLERLRQADARSGASRLGFLAGGQKWLAELGDVSEVLALPTLLHVPLTQPWFRGIANIRGGLYGVVDFSAFSGGKALADSSATRLIVLRGAVRCSLAVEQILGVSDMDGLEPKAGSAAGYVAAEYAGEDGTSWKCLNVKALVKDPVFTAVAVGGQDNQTN